MTIIDLAALRAAAERDDAGPVAGVARKWLADVLVALTDPSKVRLIDGDGGPTPMSPA